MHHIDHFYLGVVGAANKSSAALAKEDGTIIASISKAPPLTMVVNPNIRSDLEKTITDIAIQAGLSIYSLAERLCGVCAAMSGVYTHRDRLALATLLDQIGITGNFHRITCEDANAHLAANFLSTGGVVIASTGSNVFIYARGLEDALRVDGWGSAIGDDGGGYDLGRKCFRALFKASDGRLPRSDTLEKLVLEHVGVSNLDSLIEWFYRTLSTSHWRSDISNLAIPLIKAAEKQCPPDPSALRLVSDCADDLLYAFKTANRRIQTEKGEYATKRLHILKSSEPVPLILEGGIFENSSIYLQRFLNGISELESNSIQWKPIAPMFRPVVGALALAISNSPFLANNLHNILPTLQESAIVIGLSIDSHPLKEIHNA